ncbi:MAG: glycosyltransferase family 4 protein [Anaerolineae bacterium]|nr:glycosyltransferase family 4 protein [Anaerolineae bacterium]
MAYKHDPRDPMAGSGADHYFFRALTNNGIDVEISEPSIGKLHFLETGVRQLHRRFSSFRYAKYPISRVLAASRALNRIVIESKPDVIFSLYPPPLVFLRSAAPVIFRTDTTFIGQERDWPLYDSLSLKYCVWLERQVFDRCAIVITHSTWSRSILVDDYGLDLERIVVFANPAALPPQTVPPSVAVPGAKRIEYPIRLLLVGRDYRRKGIDKAIEITRMLNSAGVPSRLTVCGLSGNSTGNVEFAGQYDKSDPTQLKKYTDLYSSAHLLLHPAIFDASPIVTSEAAAFGTPTITNDVGGLGTSVKHGESGIVLPKGSPVSAYVAAIQELVGNPERYYTLCRTTRLRYERELNWESAGKVLADTLRTVHERHVASKID